MAARSRSPRRPRSWSTLELIDLGEHRLKDIPEPGIDLPARRRRFPPLKTISNTNLPRPASSFVGRERGAAEVLSRFEDGARLVTLTGPGGTGKTRLAIEAAAELVPDFKAGVFWVGLAPLRDPALVTETIAQTLGAKDGLAEHIGERELLLLLDNLEQVIEAAPDLAKAARRPAPTSRCSSRAASCCVSEGEVEYAGAAARRAGGGRALLRARRSSSLSDDDRRALPRAWTTCRWRSSWPPPARRRSRPRRSWSGSRSASTC